MLREEELRQLLEDAFAEGWNCSGQGMNAEHHSLSSEELGEMRKQAVDELMKTV